MTDDEFNAPEEMMWQMAAVALHEMGGMGVYVCPKAKYDLVLVIDRIEKRQTAH